MTAGVFGSAGAGRPTGRRRGIRIFATVTEASLQASLAQIAQIQGKLRQTHLAAHLQQIDVLSAEQVTLYVKLRGYDAGGHDHHH